MKPRIAIDCDGVVLSWRQGFSRHVRDVLGIQFTEQDFRKGDYGRRIEGRNATVAEIQSIGGGDA